MDPNKEEEQYLREPHPDHEYPYARGPFEEQAYGRHNECEIGYSRTIQPEALLGDYPDNAPIWKRDASRLLHPMVSWQGDVQIKRVDYNTVGPVGQGKASLKEVFTNGRNDQTLYTMASDGVSSFFTGRGLLAGPPVPEPRFSGPNLVLGVTIDWGVSLLNWTPFAMRIRLMNWFGSPFKGGAQRLDRDMVLYVDSKTSNGATILIPFAQRLTGDTDNPDVIPIPPIDPPGLGAMSMAIVQPAFFNILPDDPASASSPSVQVGPLPANIFPFFGATVNLMTAASPQSALYAQLEGILDAKPIRRASHTHRGK